MTKERTHTPPASAIRAFLTARFAGQAGWLCLGWIAGDPRMEPLRETWFELPRQFTAAVQCAETLAACQYNLYVAPCLFRERARLRDRFALRLAVAGRRGDRGGGAGREQSRQLPVLAAAQPAA